MQMRRHCAAKFGYGGADKWRRNKKIGLRHHFVAAHWLVIKKDSQPLSKLGTFLKHSIENIIPLGFHSFC